MSIFPDIVFVTASARCTSLSSRVTRRVSRCLADVLATLLGATRLAAARGADKCLAGSGFMVPAQLWSTTMWWGEWVVLCPSSMR